MKHLTINATTADWDTACDAAYRANMAEDGTYRPGSPAATFGDCACCGKAHYRTADRDCAYCNGRQICCRNS